MTNALHAGRGRQPLRANGSTQHRRRRRRRRGRRARRSRFRQYPDADRHIFEVTADGAAQPPAQPAPPSLLERSRLAGKHHRPAVEAPPAKSVGAGGEAQAHETGPQAETGAGRRRGTRRAASAIALPATRRKNQRGACEKRPAIATPEPEPVVAAKPSARAAARTGGRNGKVKNRPPAAKSARQQRKKAQTSVELRALPKDASDGTVTAPEQDAGRREAADRRATRRCPTNVSEFEVSFGRARWGPG